MAESRCRQTEGLLAEGALQEGAHVGPGLLVGGFVVGDGDFEFLAESGGSGVGEGRFGFGVDDDFL
jgi:hypothetical protein